MESNLDGKREEALSFLFAHTSGILATVSPEGNPHARLMYYTCDDFFNIYFLTVANTRKAGDIAAHPRAAFVISELEMPRTLQLEGTVENLTDTAVIDPLLTDFVHTLTSVKPYGIPLERFDTGTLAFYRITPDWIRWGDFTFGRGSDNVFTEIAAGEDTA